MYARSVSPLRKALLGRISPLLHKAFVRGLPMKGTAAEKPREPAHVIRIGAEEFPLRTLKGNRKVALLDLDRLRSSVREMPPGGVPSTKGIRGTVKWKDREILGDMKLSAILSMIPFIRPEEGIFEKWPAGRSFAFATQGRELCSYLEKLLGLCPTKGKHAAGVPHALHRLEGDLLVQVREKPAHRAAGEPGQPGKPRGRARRRPGRRGQGLRGAAVPRAFGAARELSPPAPAFNPAGRSQPSARRGSPPCPCAEKEMIARFRNCARMASTSFSISPRCSQAHATNPSTATLLPLKVETPCSLAYCSSPFHS